VSQTPTLSTKPDGSKRVREHVAKRSKRVKGDVVQVLEGLGLLVQKRFGSWRINVSELIQHDQRFVH
jgi:hypothetical protein